LIPTRHGPMWGLRTDACITGCLRSYGEYCEAEAAVFRQLVEPGMTVVDMQRIDPQNWRSPMPGIG
ncbi:MAG TPA: hypothetical protein VE309_10045, partial [Caulobacteraceae bacterium]|nr:hypothetical protein [Caulobacteraceae bacterium]